MTDATTATSYGAVIFDLDGTLVDSSADIADAMNFAFAAQGIAPVSAAAVGAALGGGPRVLVTKCLAAVGHDASVEVIDAVLDGYSQRYRAYPAVRTALLDTASTVLPALHSRGVLLGVCTNKRTGIAREVIAAVGLGEIIGAVVGSDATTAPKPLPGHLTETVAALGAAQRRALYVGDTDIDMSAAHAADIDYAQVAWGHDTVPARYQLSTFDDLLTIV